MELNIVLYIGLTNKVRCANIMLKVNVYIFKNLSKLKKPIIKRKMGKSKRNKDYWQKMFCKRFLRTFAERKPAAPVPLSRSGLLPVGPARVQPRPEQQTGRCCNI